MNEVKLLSIGTVRSSVGDPSAMPIDGVPASIEVGAGCLEGLAGIESNSHIYVLGWLHEAPRHLLASDPPRGVFGLRSAARPNPIGLSAARLLKVEGNVLHLDRLDMVDGTPVLDIKRYSPGWDSIFSARTSRDLGFPADRDPQQVMRDMLVEAANFHGERCVGAALGVRMMYEAMRFWQIGAKDPSLRLWLGEDGCVTDALAGLSAITPGSGRLKLPGGRIYRIARGLHSLAFKPQQVAGLSADDVLQADAESLFVVREEVLAPPKEMAERPPTRPPELWQELKEKIQGSLVNDRLPCAVAFKLAKGLGVHVTEVGQATDESGIRIARCQLGCFK